MFQSVLQFVFNNSALNMLGYSIEAESKTKFVVCFYSGILMGHMLSCVYSPEFLSLGTSCGTIALLPLEICRYFRVKRVNYLASKKRKRFLFINLVINFVLNGLAIFNLDMVDWISHIGSITSGVLLLFYFENMKYISDFAFRNHKVIKRISIALLVILYTVLIFTIFFYLPLVDEGR